MFLKFRFLIVCFFFFWLTNLQVSSNYFDLYRRPRGSKVLASVLQEKLRNFKSVNLILYSNSKVTYSQDEERIIHLLVTMLSSHIALYISCIQSENPKTFFESTANIYVIEEKSLNNEDFLQRFSMLAPLCVIIAVSSICDEDLREVKEFYQNINVTNNIFVFRYCSNTKRGNFKYAIYKAYNLNSKIEDKIEILEVNSTTISSNSTANLNEPPFQFDENVLQRIAYQDTKVPEIEVSEKFTELKTFYWPEIININELKDLRNEKQNQNNFSKILLKNVKNIIFFQNVKEMSYFDTREFDYAISISQKDCTFSWSSSIPFYKQWLQKFHYSNWIFFTALLLLSMFFGEIINDYDWKLGYDNKFTVFNAKGLSKIPWRLKVLTWIAIILRQPIRFPSNLGSPQKVFIGSLFIIGATFYESFQVNLMANCITKPFLDTKEPFMKPCEGGSTLNVFSNTLSENCKIKESMSIYIFPKYSPYFEVFNRHLHLTNTAGLANQWFSNSCFKKKMRYSSIKSRNEKRNSKDLSALMIVLSTGLIIACLTLVIEILYSKYVI